MLRRYQDQRGFTIVELMVTIMIIGLLLGFGVYNFMGDVPTYRLRAAARQMAAQVQFLKVRAVATNRIAWFRADPTGGFYTGFVDADADGAADNPSEYNDTGMSLPDSAGGVPCVKLPPSVSFGLPNGFSSGSGPDGSPFPSGPVTTADLHIGFRPTGLPVINLTGNVNPVAPVAFYLRNIKGEGYAVSVQITGRVKTFRWTGGTWQ